VIGRTLGRYRILEAIGAGAMGQVFRAHDEKLSRDVAIKVLAPGLIADEAARRRFRKEALALSQLNHPVIATLHDFDTVEGVDFLVMELISGETLERRLARGAVPLAEATRLGAELARGLAAAHEHQVVHRDLKPANIRITPDGRPKILDFGLALLPRPAGTLDLSATNAGAATVSGTLPYMSPEVLRGEPASERSDLYSLGCVLYEMTTGRRPHPEQQVSQLLYAVLHQAPRPPRALNPEISEGMQRVIGRAMAKEPDERYGSATAIAADLESVGAGGGPVAAPAGRRRWIAALVATALLAAVAGAALLQRERSPEPGGEAPRVQSLAVLPLANLSGDPAQDYFADGMTEALTSQLASMGGVRVISRTSTMRYKGSTKSVPQIGRELKVDALLEGSVMREGDQVRITAQLIHAPTDRHLWSQVYDREMRQVLALQSEVAQAVAQQIRMQVSPGVQARMARTAAVDPETYELYLKGRHFFGQWSGEGALRGIEFFRRALARDSLYAPAHSGLADCYLFLGTLTTTMPLADALRQARASADRAIQLQPGLAEALVSRGYIRLIQDWDYSGGERDLKRALELAPNQSAGVIALGMNLIAQGRTEEALAQQRMARELDPLSVGTTWQAALVLYYARHYEEAINAFESGLQVDSTVSPMLWQLGTSYEMLGRFPEAVAYRLRAWRNLGMTPERIAALQQAFGSGGMQGYRRAEIAAMEAIEGFFPVELACAYALLGDRDGAIRWLEKAIRNRSQRLPWTAADPAFDSLRQDPRFRDILRRLGRPA
jgi:serine/threonine-protein kinase